MTQSVGGIYLTGAQWPGGWCGGRCLCLSTWLTANRNLLQLFFILSDSFTFATEHSYELGYGIECILCTSVLKLFFLVANSFVKSIDCAQFPALVVADNSCGVYLVLLT